MGSLTMDLTAGADRLPEAGETLLGTEFAMVPGGKGNNQAIACARQGVATAMVGRIGGDAFGEQVLARLRADGVDATGVERDPRLATGIAHIRVDSSGQNSIIMVPIANFALDPQAVQRLAGLLTSARVLLTQLEIRIDATREALRLARCHGVMTILNPAPAAVLDDALLSEVDVCVPNEVEAAALTGESTDTLAGAVRAALKLRDRGCGAVIVTLGDRGSVYVDAHRVLAVAPISVRTVDTVAAGDAYCGALAASFARGRSVDESLVRASAAGALATTLPGATSSLPTAAAVDSLLHEAGKPVIRALDSAG